MKTIILTLLGSLILSSCASYEDNKEVIDKAYSYKAENKLAVIYILRDFETVNKQTSLHFGMFQVNEPDSRNKLVDAMDSLDGDSTKGAGIPYNFYRFHEKSFARLEMPPGKYNIFASFIVATESEMAQSRKEKNFQAGKVYFFKITPKSIGAFSSTVYLLKELSVEEGKRVIDVNNLKLIDFKAAY